MFCGKCGSDNFDTNEYCVKCGAQLSLFQKSMQATSQTSIPEYSTSNIKDKMNKLTPYRKMISIAIIFILIISLASYAASQNFMPTDAAQTTVIPTTSFVESITTSTTIFRAQLILESGTYLGAVVDGKPNGLGRMTYNNGEIYDGNWVNGLRNGDGELIKVNGEKIRGTWDKDQLTWSQIIVEANINDTPKETTTKQSSKTTASTTVKQAPTTTVKLNHIEFTNAVYDGDTLNGEPNGHGKMVFTNGNIIEGTWTNGKIEGYGIYRWANGDIYEGNFANGAMNGTGKVTKADGTVITGTWSNGNFVPPPTEAFNMQNRNNLLDRINSDLQYAYDKLEYYRLKISDLNSRGAGNSSLMDSANNSYNTVQGYIDQLKAIFDASKVSGSNNEIMQYYNQVLDIENALVGA